MTGYKIKFNGIDRLYDEYSWRLTRRAKQVWSSGNVLQGQYLNKFERELGKKYKKKPRLQLQRTRNIGPYAKV